MSADPAALCETRSRRAGGGFDPLLFLNPRRGTAEVWEREIQKESGSPGRSQVWECWQNKVGLKRNSLFGTEANQQQDSIENFCRKISAGKKALKTSEFLIIARIESLILEQGMEDALQRAAAYVEAGAGGIMIHSRRKEPDEIFEFCRRFREKDPDTVLVIVPTSFNSVTEEEWKERGVNVVIYANHLIRSGYPAMQKTAETILRCRRAKEADEAYCMPIKEILTLIPEE